VDLDELGRRAVRQPGIRVDRVPEVDALAEVLLHKIKFGQVPLAEVVVHRLIAVVADDATARLVGFAAQRELGPRDLRNMVPVDGVLLATVLEVTVARAEDTLQRARTGRQCPLDLHELRARHAAVVCMQHSLLLLDLLPEPGLGGQEVLRRQLGFELGDQAVLCPLAIKCFVRNLLGKCEFGDDHAPHGTVAVKHEGKVIQVIPVQLVRLLEVEVLVHRAHPGRGTSNQTRDTFRIFEVKCGDGRVLRLNLQAALDEQQVLTLRHVDLLIFADELDLVGRSDLERRQPLDRHAAAGGLDGDAVDEIEVSVLEQIHDDGKLFNPQIDGVIGGLHLPPLLVLVAKGDDAAGRHGKARHDDAGRDVVFCQLHLDAQLCRALKLEDAIHEAVRVLGLACVSAQVRADLIQELVPELGVRKVPKVVLKALVGKLHPQREQVL